MAEWMAVAPQILFMVAVLGVPGFLVALCLRFRTWDAVGLSVPLSLGIVAIANLLSSKVGLDWGLAVVAGTTAVVMVAALVWFRITARHRVGDASKTFDGVQWTAAQSRLVLVVTLAAGVIGVFAVARGMGSPDTLNQTFDGAFHVNSIAAIAERRTAGPGVFAQMGNPAAIGGFYPPSFSALASFEVIYFGLNPVAAANVSALAIVALWPFAVSILIRRVARPSAFGYSIAMLGAVTIGLYPSLLLEWGTVWPNVLSVLTIGPAIVVTMRLLGIDRTRVGATDPSGRWSLAATIFVAAVMVPGMALAHPSSIFGSFYLVMPLVVWACWRRLIDERSDRRRKATVVAALAVGATGLVLGVVALARLVPGIKSVGGFYWAPRQPWWDAVVQAFALTSRQSHANLAFAVLVLVGMGVGLRAARVRFLTIGFATIAVLYMSAIAIQKPATMFLTGFWYNDPVRIIAMLPLMALPLAAVGADGVYAQVVRGVGRWREKHPQAVLAHPNRAPGVAMALVIFAVLVLQGGLGTARISSTVKVSYRYEHGLLVSPGQEAMFRRLAQRLEPDQTIAGNPFTGEILAGVLSGRQVIYPVFRGSPDPVRSTVAADFRSFTSDPVVCAAVKSLNIAVVVTGRMSENETPSDRSYYQGFSQMATIPGLTKVDSGGGATAYRVGACNSAPYVSGPLLTLGQQQMFKRLSGRVPVGTTIAGSPYQGEIFATVARAAVVYPTFGTPATADQRLVAREFRNYLNNPSVCAAVKRLKIGTVVTGPTYEGVNRAAQREYAGFHRLGGIPGLWSGDLAAVPGLTMIDSGGGATAYRVGACIGGS